VSSAKVIHKKIEERGTVFLATHLETGNANIFLLSEKEARLGTLAVAIPQKMDRVGPPISSILLGERNVTISRLIAERLARNTGKIALVSVFLETVNDAEGGLILLKLVEKNLKESIK
jgi:hypothetical protein